MTPLRFLIVQKIVLAVGGGEDEELEDANGEGYGNVRRDSALIALTDMAVVSTDHELDPTRFPPPPNATLFPT